MSVAGASSSSEAWLAGSEAWLAVSTSTAAEAQAGDDPSLGTRGRHGSPGWGCSGQPAPSPAHTPGHSLLRTVLDAGSPTAGMHPV